MSLRHHRFEAHSPVSDTPISNIHWLNIVSHVTLRLFNIAMENGPFIDGLPIKNCDFPWLC